MKTDILDMVITERINIVGSKHLSNFKVKVCVTNFKGECVEIILDLIYDSVNKKAAIDVKDHARFLSFFQNNFGMFAIPFSIINFSVKWCSINNENPAVVRIMPTIQGRYSSQAAVYLPPYYECFGVIVDRGSREIVGGIYKSQILRMKSRSDFIEVECMVADWLLHS